MRIKKDCEGEQELMAKRLIRALCKTANPKCHDTEIDGTELPSLSRAVSNYPDLLSKARSKI
jgi:hypothetical protein